MGEKTISWLECSVCGKQMQQGDVCERCLENSLERGLKEPEVARVSKSRCQSCKMPVTWMEQKRQFARCLQKGMTAEQAQAILPRHQKCLTQFLGQQG